MPQPLASAIAALSCAFVLSTAPSALAQNRYPLTPDSEKHDKVPAGRVESFKHVSKIYPGAEYNCWIYIPAQYKPDHATPSMVFLDGGGFQSNGGFRIPIVFDNLIAKGEMPATIGIFIDPGVVPAANKNALPRYNRSAEYDAVTDTYAKFLLEEIYPAVGKKYNLSSDPNDRGISGASSGGICAFNAAWQRPDAFRRVVTFIGSYTNLRGGHNPAWMIRKYEPRPIRVWMQDGVNDQNIYSGWWYLGNQDVFKALEWAGYDVQFVTGDGGHDGTQGIATIPDGIRYVWKDYPKPVAVPSGTKQPIMINSLLPNEDWKLVNEAYPATLKLDKKPRNAVANTIVRDHKGRTYFARMKKGETTLVSWDGKKEIETKTTLKTPVAACLSPDQTLLYVADADARFVYAYQIAPDGSIVFGQDYFDISIPYDQVKSGVTSLAVDTHGWLYAGTSIGIQMLDQAGRVNGIISTPSMLPVEMFKFDGPKLDQLVLKAGGKVYRRNVKAIGVDPMTSPIKPDGPRL